ncbi:NAD-dependent epimerase/dehydratase family protein [Luteitalea sp.]|uniref:NAD-dependent epimerase/dehydratase family protein n=1 Tax=Luteitalea sp. TaxID=2004800 RepID=UPI0025C4FB24|nr:NAD-dependent epimerase/dehydratase family protein [Luteitalea sp.]
MKALVTGAAGFIGSTLTDRLLSQGADVVGIDCFTDYYPRALKERNLAAARQSPRFRFVEDDLLGTDLDALLDGVTHIFHLAAQAGVRKSWGRDFGVYVHNNIAVSQRLLEACAGRPLDRFVYASTSSVYGDDAPIPMREDQRLQPLSPYGVSKLAAEHLGHLYHVNHGLPFVALRYFTVYGPRQRPDMGFHRFLTAAMDGRPLTRYGDGEQTRDFTFVADAVTGTVAAGTRGVPGRVYNLGGGARVTVNDVFAMIGRLVGEPIAIDQQPPQKGDMRDTYADTSRAATDLGFAPSVTLEQGLAEEYAWLRSERA